ncbi:hypothetical protein [Sulfurospirillum multivorans]|uniref:Uncharacterized protein n=1 Tax=Sulfurospirillum multivorans (strain DM 12446 / JCM 15788 / NBRC 109480) TaxID=1150621 RepID=A0AA86AM67_SULMK|nr:hypothetical protein [Sulfurospirillum multivorans]AHJ12341.1 hypothetical protein SMUL_1075 [Sulfurospirillum multivorans DSM 12446]AHJ13251.1 hypothetical protein SMUL_1996 [Sulfurospirillum multivorans DSM 12446]
MPKYRVQLKQGSRTIVNHVEASSSSAVLAFFESVSTMQVSEILKVDMKNDTIPPADDFGYYPVFKGIMKTDTRRAKQIIINNVKLGKNEQEIAIACKTFLEIEGTKVDSLYCALFKQDRS